MPNLRQFIISILTSPSISLSWDTLLNGHNWQQLLINHISHLDVFDLFVFVIGNPNTFLLDMNNIVHSFDYFSTKYDDWHVAITQSKYNIKYHCKIIILIYFLKYKFKCFYVANRIRLHALRYSKDPPCKLGYEQQMVLGTFTIHSTDTQYHRFHYNIGGLRIEIPLNTILSDNRSSSPPYQHVTLLSIRNGPSSSSFRNTVMNLSKEKND